MLFRSPVRFSHDRAAYTRIREYFDFYAVPLDLIWKSFDASVIQMGEIAPVQSKDILTVFWDLGIPNCTYDINLQYFTRTRPVQTAAYTRIREYFDFYAVPLDLIWKSFDAFFPFNRHIATPADETCSN